MGRQNIKYNRQQLHFCLIQIDIQNTIQKPCDKRYRYQNILNLKSKWGKFMDDNNVYVPATALHCGSKSCAVITCSLFNTQFLHLSLVLVSQLSLSRTWLITKKIGFSPYIKFIPPHTTEGLELIHISLQP